MFIIWGLEMKLKTKLLVVGILAFAAIGSTGTVVRMFYIHTLMDGPDFLYSTTDVAIWSTVEPGIGIAAGSIACLRPLFRVWLWRLGLAAAPRERQSRNYYSSNSGQRRKGRRGYRRSLSPSDLVPTERNHTEALGTSKEVDIWVHPASTNTATEPELELTTQGPIVQSSDPDYNFEPPPHLELRDSFRNSFGSILSLGKFRIPT